MSVLPACISMYHLHLGYPQRLKDGAGPPRIGDR